MIRYELSDGRVIEVAYGLTHGALVVVDLFEAEPGRVVGGWLVSSRDDVRAAWRAWRAS